MFCFFTTYCLVTVPNNEYYWATVVMPLPAGDSIATSSWGWRVKVKLYYDWWSDDESPWCQAPTWGQWPNSYFLKLSLGSRGFVKVGRPLWLEDGSVVYSSCWASPAQSFSGPSSAGLLSILYCLKFRPPPPSEPGGQSVLREGATT
jgi:hypothetical protein